MLRESEGGERAGTVGCRERGLGMAGGCEHGVAVAWVRAVGGGTAGVAGVRSGGSCEHASVHTARTIPRAALAYAGRA